MKVSNMITYKKRLDLHKHLEKCSHSNEEHKELHKEMEDLLELLRKATIEIDNLRSQTQ